MIPPFEAASVGLRPGRLGESATPSKVPPLKTKFDIRDDLPPRREAGVFQVQYRRPNPGLVLFTAAFTALICAGLCVAAILARAPVAVVPLIALICVGCPM